MKAMPRTLTAGLAALFVLSFILTPAQAGGLPQTTPAATYVELHIPDTTQTTVYAGDTVTLNAYVYDFGQTTNVDSGTVEFYDTFNNETTLLGSDTINSFVATWNVPGFLPGTHSLTAKFLGTSSWAAGESSAGSLTVTAIPTTTTMTLESADITYGSPANITIQLTSTYVNLEGQTVNPVPTGSVKLYDGADLAGEYALTNGATQVTIPDFAAGIHALYAEYAAQSYFDASTSATTNLTVARAVLTVTADDHSKLYGQPNPELTYGFSGFKLDDDESVVGGTLADISTTADETSPVGEYDIIVSQGTLAADNYTFTFVSGTLTINPATLTVTANDAERLYGEENPDFSVTYTGFFNGDDQKPNIVNGIVVLSTTAGVASDVGKYEIKVNVSGLTASNYTFISASGWLTIQQATATVVADDKSKVYGQDNPALSYHYEGLLNGDVESELDHVAIALDTDAEKGSEVGAYDITVDLTGMSDNNYLFTSQSGTLTVGPAPLTVFAEPKSKVYGDPNPALTFDYTGFVNNDTADTAVTGSPDIVAMADETTEVDETTPVGEYAIVIEAGTLAAKNYELHFQNGTLTITPALLTVTADNQERLYGAPNPDLTYQITGFVNNDGESLVQGVLALSTEADATSDVGEYEIAVDVNDLSADNYAFTGVSGTLTVQKAPLAVIADDQSKVYGETNPALTFGYSGFVNGDSAAADLTGGPDISARTDGGGEVDETTPVGVYTILVKVGTLTAKNYEFTFENGALEITKKDLIVRADPKHIKASAPMPLFTVTYVGFVNGDTAETALDQPPTLSTDAASTDVAGEYTIYVSVDGITAPNYTLLPENGKLTIDNYLYYLPITFYHSKR